MKTIGRRHSWISGRMGSNDDAVSFLRKTRPARLDMSLIARALECHWADADPDLARTSLQPQVAACAALLSGQAPAG